MNADNLGTGPLALFVAGYAALLDLPANDRRVQQLARGAVDMAEDGLAVLTHGHGRYGVEVHSGAVGLTIRETHHKRGAA